MPYGDLLAQRVQCFATPADLDAHACTIEEREEYAPYLERGLSVYAGVDYGAIVEEASREHDVLLWDGGNNDFSFLHPTLHVCMLDALRPGHELSYHPGETNLRSADVVIVNKVSSAAPEAVEAVRRSARTLAPRAALLEGDLAITVERPEAIAGKRVLAVEDGPSVTHGGMTFGAATVACRTHGAREILDPRPFAVGSIAAAYAAYPHMGPVLPALGYSEDQRRELVETIARSGAEAVVDASPSHLDRFLQLAVPVVRVRYRFVQRSGPSLLDLVSAVAALTRRAS
jgi:predicted GTPase